MKNLLFLGLCLSLIASCSLEPCINKAYFLGTFKNFMKAVEKEKEHFSAEDWQSKDEKMRGFVNDCYFAHQDEMSAEDKANFWTSYVKYMVTRHTSNVMNAIEKEDDNSPVNIYEEILKSVEDLDIKQFLKENYGKEIEVAIDVVMNKIENLGEQLKKWLNSEEN